MQYKGTGTRLLAAVALVLLLALSATSAVATDGRGPVPNDPVVAGVHLGGMSEAEAAAAIASAVKVRVLAPLPVSSPAGSFSYPATGSVRVDVDAMLADAYASTAPSATILPRFEANSDWVRVWVNATMRRVDRPVVNASRTLVSGRLSFRHAATGYQTDPRTSVRTIARFLEAGAAAGKMRTTAVPLTVAVLKPKVNDADLGKAILVDLSQRKLYLYSGTSLEKTYDCAIGQPEYPTPKGTWKIIKKVKLPAWYNPGSAWASGMPSYIPPGPSNPLGTRALYLNADGIRIHGTENVRSIGTAASHGCIRLQRRNIEDLFERVPVGTPVYIVA